MTNLQLQRIKNNITQSQLAKICNMSESTLKAYEQGQKSIDGAKIRTLVTITSALNCKIEDILEDQYTIDLINKIYAS